MSSLQCVDGSSSSDSDEVFVSVWSLAKRGGSSVQGSKRGAKVDRSPDERTPWCRTTWDGHVAAKIRTNSWNEYYHMPVSCFDHLHSLLFRETPAEIAMSKVKAANSTRMGCIDSKVKLALTLRQLFGEKRKSMVDVFIVSPTSAREAFLNVIRRINECPELAGNLFSTDHSVSVLEIRAHEFALRSSYPNIFRHAVGAIDGLFIKTDMPKAKEVGAVRTYYSGHKKHYGLNMQGVCDASCRFIGFACNTAGSTSDYVAFRHSNFYGHWPLLPEPFYYLGDCAYPLAPFCMTPFIGTNVGEAEDAFNFYHSQLRITIERAFGIFVNVFGIFQSSMSYSIANTCEVVEACVRLHNFRIDQGCQNVSRRMPNGAVFRHVQERGSDVFDVLDDPRYCTDRPHATDAAYAQAVAASEVTAGNTDNAIAGENRRDAVAERLQSVGAARPLSNAY